ncbi:MAG: hypothetical protein ACRD34_01665, partial [Bryobacteraceae bacterium]
RRPPGSGLVPKIEMAGLLKKQIRDFSSGGFGQGGWRIWRCGDWILRNEPNSGGGADVVLRNEASPLP